MASLLNKTRVRELALEAAQCRRLTTGEPRFTRVSGAWLSTLEAEVAASIRGKVHRLPSIGRTIR